MTRNKGFSIDFKKDSTEILHLGIDSYDPIESKDCLELLMYGLAIALGQRELIDSNDLAHTAVGGITSESSDPVEEGSAASLNEAAAKDILNYYLLACRNLPDLLGRIFIEQNHFCLNTKNCFKFIFVYIYSYIYKVTRNRSVIPTERRYISTQLFSLFLFIICASRLSLINTYFVLILYTFFQILFFKFFHETSKNFKIICIYSGYLFLESL